MTEIVSGCVYLLHLYILDDLRKADAVFNLMKVKENTHISAVILIKGAKHSALSFICI